MWHLDVELFFVDKGGRLLFLDSYALLACQKYSLEVPSPPDQHHGSPLGVALFATSIQGEAKCYVGTETDAVQRLVFREAELIPFLLELGWCLWMLDSSVCKTMKCSQRWHLSVRASVLS